MPNLCVIPARAAEDERLTHRDLRALLAVGMYTNHAGQGVWASQKTMAERVNMTRPQMNESLKRLEMYGYIRKRHRKSQGGAMLTCIIDIVLDPVPESGTPPVPDLGTPPVPDLGTQTKNYVNDPTTDITTRVRNAVPEPYRPDLDLLLSTVKHPVAILRELEALHNGMHASFTWDVIGRAVHDIVVAGASVTPRTLRVFCAGVTAPTATPSPKARGVDISRIRQQLEAAPKPET